MNLADAPARIDNVLESRLNEWFCGAPVEKLEEKPIGLLVRLCQIVEFTRVSHVI